MTKELMNQIESLLFSSGRKMDVAELQTHLGLGSAGVVVEGLEQLRQEYDARGSSLMIVEEGGLWKIAVREKYISLARKINPNTELTKSMMETLAVIAWKQPITQSEVVAIRTNKAYEHIAELDKMGFLNKERYGRTYMLKLTQKFFDYFDLQGAQNARDLFKDIKETEETQKKLEEARAAAGIPAEGLSPEEVEAHVETHEEGDTMDEQPTNEAQHEEHKELTVTDHGTSQEDMVAEDENVAEAAAEQNEHDAHEDAVDAGNVEEDIDNPDDRAHMVDDDEISSDEDGFVAGYEQDAEETQNHSSDEQEDA